MCCARCAHLCLTGGLHGPQICPKSPRWRTTTASALKTLQPVLHRSAPPPRRSGGFGEETTSQHLQPQAPAVAAARDAGGKRKQLTLANATKKLQGLAYYLNGRITRTIFNHATVMDVPKREKMPPSLLFPLSNTRSLGHSNQDKCLLKAKFKGLTIKRGSVASRARLGSGGPLV